MSEVIQLNHQSENTYEFDLEVDGIATIQMIAWFVIVGKGMEFTFPCTQEGNHFTCVLPPMPFLEKTAYKGAIRLVADDYYFEVVNDLVVNVTGNLSFERGDVKNMTVKSTIDGKKKVVASEEKREVKKEEKKEEKREVKKEVSPEVKKSSTTTAKKEAPKKVVAKSDKKEVPKKVVAKSDKKDVPKNDKKISESSVDTTVERIESPSDIAKRLLAETANKPVVASDNRIVRKGSVASPQESKDVVIENEVSEFVNTQKSEKEEKLRALLKNFTVAPTTTSTKARFTKKT